MLTSQTGTPNDWRTLVCDALAAVLPNSRRPAVCSLNRTGWHAERDVGRESAESFLCSQPRP